MMYLLGVVPLLLMLAVIIPLFGFFWRAVAARLFPPLPAGAPWAPRPARAGEALIILVTGLLLLAVAMFRYETDYVPHLIEHLPAFQATTLFIATVAAPLIVAAAAFLALRGRGTVALTLGALCVVAYMLFLSQVSRATMGQQAGPTDPLKEPYTIYVVGQDIPGARLWVNGVDLGTLPYRGTVGEFLAKVPRWDEPPADYKTDTTDHVEYYLTNEPYTVHEHHWITYPAISNLLGNGQNPAANRGTNICYYARVQYAGEWAIAAGSAGGSGGWGTCSSSFSIKLPQRDQRLARLLNLARVHDYRVDAAWIAAAETFHGDARNAILAARATEPGMQRVWDAWARTKYPVDSATSPEAAWALFERIAAEADAAGSYDTLTPQGHAVEMIAPRLPPERLLTATGKLLRQIRGHYAFTYGTRLGTFAFGTINSGYSDRIAGTFGNLSDITPPSALVAAHALLAFHQAQLKDGIYPTLVQQKVVPDILRLDPDWDSTLHVAAYLGGPVAADYFVRRALHGSSDFRDTLHVNMNSVNKWLYLVSQMQDPAAVAYRKAHPQEFLDLAGQLTPTWDGQFGDDVDFLFEDAALAERLWPQFSRRLSIRADSRNLVTKFQYLNRMHAEPAHYLDVFRTSPTEYPEETLEVLSELANIADPGRRGAVIAAFRDVALPPWVRAGNGRPDPRLVFNQILDAAVNPVPDFASQRGLAEIRVLKTPQEFARVLPWLQSEKAPLHLPELLASDADPRLRLLAAQTLAQFPTAQRRELLARLTQDGDGAIQQAAREGLQGIAVLGASLPPTSGQ